MRKPAVLTAPLPDLKGKNLNVLSYSLWIDDPKHPRKTKPSRAYVGGLVENAKLAPEIYPGWVVHTYLCDKIAHMKPALEDLGVKVTLYRNEPF